MEALKNVITPFREFGTGQFFFEPKTSKLPVILIFHIFLENEDEHFVFTTFFKILPSDGVTLAYASIILLLFFFFFLSKKSHDATV